MSGSILQHIYSCAIQRLSGTMVVQTLGKSATQYVCQRCFCPAARSSSAASSRTLTRVSLSSTPRIQLQLARGLLTSNASRNAPVVRARQSDTSSTGATNLTSSPGHREELASSAVDRSAEDLEASPAGVDLTPDEKAVPSFVIVSKSPKEQAGAEVLADVDLASGDAVTSAMDSSVQQQAISDPLTDTEVAAADAATPAVDSTAQQQADSDAVDAETESLLGTFRKAVATDTPVNQSPLNVPDNSADYAKAVTEVLPTEASLSAQSGDAPPVPLTTNAGVDASWRALLQEFIDVAAAGNHFKTPNTPKAEDFAVGTLKKGLLNFARSRQDVVYLLPGDKVKDVINARLPWVERKVLSTVT